MASDFIPNFFGTPGRTGLVFLVGGSVATYFAAKSTDVKSRNIGIAIGSGIIGIGVVKLVSAFPTLPGVQAITDTARFASSFTPTALARQAVIKAAPTIAAATDVFKRATGDEPAPSVTTAPSPATPGVSPLDKPKNILRITGRILSPGEGTTITRKAFADTVVVDAEIANAGSAPQFGEIQARALYYPRTGRGFGASDTKLVSGGKLTLIPGERRAVSMRVPREAPHLFSRVGPMDVSLLFAGHTLARVQFNVQDSFT